MKNNITTPIILAILALGILNGCSSRSGPPASVHYDKMVSPYHVVKKGESIASISRQYGMDKRELIRINGLESPYRIVKGQRLVVRPKGKKSAVPDDGPDEDGMTSSEEVSSVPEEGGVQVKPLAPFGPKGVATGKLNPETDEEVDGEDGGGRAGQPYDEEKIDAAERRVKRPDIDRPSSRTSEEAPAAANEYRWPVKGTVTRTFNPSGKGKEQNDGINIAAAKGTPVVAANNGVVAHAGNQLRGFGNVVLVKHDNGTMTVYAHLDKVSVKKGDAVRAGQKLGAVGQTGTVKEPQLHFEIRKGRKPIDPNKYLE